MHVFLPTSILGSFFCFDGLFDLMFNQLSVDLLSLLFDHFVGALFARRCYLVKELVDLFQTFFFELFRIVCHVAFRSFFLAPLQELLEVCVKQFKNWFENEICEEQRVDDGGFLVPANDEQVGDECSDELKDELEELLAAVLVNLVPEVLEPDRLHDCQL
jgi:hypothetical protein